MARTGRARGRLKIQWIMDNTKRKEALRRRLPNLLKKTRELAVLCDVPACVVVYGPDETQPVAWPAPGAAADVVRQYRDKPSLKRFNNELDGTGFLKQRNEKEQVKLSKLEQQNCEGESKLAIADFLAGRGNSFEDVAIGLLPSIGDMVQNKLQEVHARLQELGSAAAPAMQPLVPLPMVATPLPWLHDCPSPMTIDDELRHALANTSRRRGQRK